MKYSNVKRMKYKKEFKQMLRSIKDGGSSKRRGIKSDAADLVRPPGALHPPDNIIQTWWWATGYKSQIHK